MRFLLLSNLGLCFIYIQLWLIFLFGLAMGSSIDHDMKSISVTLNGFANYAHWRFAMKNLLIEKDLQDIVDGTMT